VSSQVIIRNGGVGEWLKPAVLKTVRPERVSGVRIPPPPPRSHALSPFQFVLAENANVPPIISECRESQRLTFLSHTNISAYLRGLAYLRLKKGELAAAEFRKVLDHSGIGAGFVTEALAILQLARAQILMHDEKGARKSYEDFLALWKSADSDLPIYKEAKAEYSALLRAAEFTH
jgi:hypothetical protein